jgi:hypothetical protein
MKSDSVYWRGMFSSFLCFFTCCFQFLNANASRDVFAKYLNPCFIETGSYYGDGIQMALDAGFEMVYSIELSPEFYEHCKNRFASQSSVLILQGDSTTVLPELLKQINDPATFWLDGHYSWGNTARGNTNSPILAELEAIKQHQVKTHTILVDDIRQCGTIEFDYVELEDIIDKILEINPDYVISFEDGVVPNDVLIAKVL